MTAAVVVGVGKVGGDSVAGLVDAACEHASSAATTAADAKEAGGDVRLRLFLLVGKEQALSASFLRLLAWLYDRCSQHFSSDEERCCLKIPHVTAPQAMAGTSKPFCMFLAPPLVCLLSRHCNDVLIVPIMQPSSKGTEHSALDLGRRVAELGRVSTIVHTPSATTRETSTDS